MAIRTTLTACLLFGMNTATAWAAPATASSPAPRVITHPGVISTMNQLFQTATCTEAAYKIMDQWQTKDEWIAFPPGLDGSKKFRTPTQKIGVWIQITFFPNRSIELKRFTAQSAVLATWEGANCSPRLQVQNTKTPQRKKSPDSILTDDQLAEIFRSAPQGLIYAWSPHMPLSVRGYPEAKQMAEKLKIKFIPVLDPGADLKAATEISKKQKMESLALQKMGAIELLGRGMNQHYPAILIYSDRKITSHLFPGYWDKLPVLENFVRSHL